MESIPLEPATPADASAIHALVRRSEVHDREPLVTPLDEIEELFDEPHLDPAQDMRVVKADRRVIGYGAIWHHPSGERQERAYLFGTVDPHHRGRGVGRTLFAWQVERASARLRSYGHDLPRYLRTSAWDWLEDALHLYERFGFQPVRWFDELLRPLGPALPPFTPEGITVQPWQPERSDEVRLLHNRAFADHWGSTPVDAAWWKQRLSGHGMRLDLSFLALAGDRAAGYALNEVYPEDEALLGRRDGWIGMLGVDAPFRKRGVASALIATSMEAFGQAGLTHAAIGVDADSPTGAHRLYSQLGFRLEKRRVTHQLEI